MKSMFLAFWLPILFGTVADVAASGLKVVDEDRYIVKYNNGVVHDTRTGLQWYSGPDRSTSWQEARSWVAALEVDGGGWRMPTKKELRTLHHVGNGISNITVLLYNSGFWIWSGATEQTASEWLFSFSYGGEGWPGIPPPDGGRALAVRSP